MKTAMWLYLFMFIAMFDLHAQYPVLSPFALSLGAAPSFIGFIMGIYSLTHLPGNMLAGYGVDRYGSKIFITLSLIGAGALLLLQAYASNPWQLLAIRSVSGFVLAFLSPACMSLLAKLAKDTAGQGKYMAGNGLVHTLASVLSPAAGALLVAKLGFSASFTILGWGLIVTGLLALFFIHDVPTASKVAAKGDAASPPSPLIRAAERAPAQALAANPTIPWLFYAIPLALSCSQGILFFELPLLNLGEQSLMTSGLLFSVVSLGSLVTLSMLFLNKLSPFYRTAVGSFFLAIVFFGMAVEWALPMAASLFLIGMAKGMIYPAMATLLASITQATHYGRIFALLSVCFSIGAFIGPTIAGQIRDSMSPYFIAFVVLMLALSALPYSRPRSVTIT
ncbi:MFS transporter [Xylanibacillus composti]|uniref:Major facilitator superfamily (MFS) profile domain-containing protein n=1 Tax=Xylanibacillus composti TaxID=1572762 RepID=A0A8J4H4A8_9BACL|nr:MFS transporter [Xylanibacillus composti]MDT9723526.1 MFS transporter [Xylanibacillus composti]GIQ68438.1 hypothetical protein XYCOK13_12620 [Xylanibacillus composti]